MATTVAMEVEMQASGDREFAQVGRRLLEAGRGELQKKLRENIRDAGRPVVEEIRTAVRAVEVESTQGGMAPPSYSRGLRQKAASGTRMYVSYRGVRFVVHASYVGAGKYSGALLRYLDAELPMYKNWRHPVFGNKDVWTVQHGSPWFFVTVRRNAARFENACLEAMDQTVREIAR